MHRASRSTGHARAGRIGPDPAVLPPDLAPDPVRVRLLRAVLDAGYGRRVDLVAMFRRQLRLDEERARAEVARFTHLVAGAGVGWVDLLLRGLEQRPSCRPPSC